MAIFGKTFNQALYDSLPHSTEPQIRDAVRQCGGQPGSVCETDGKRTLPVLVGGEVVTYLPLPPIKPCNCGDRKPVR